MRVEYISRLFSIVKPEPGKYLQVISINRQNFIRMIFEVMLRDSLFSLQYFFLFSPPPGLIYN